MFKKLNRNLRWLLRKRRRDKNLLFTRNNICIDREIDYDGNEVCAYVEVWFNPEKKFGLSLPGNDYVNVYAFITPYTGDVRIAYIIYYADGFIDNERPFKALTQNEKQLILEMVNEVSLKETGITVEDNWREYVKNDPSINVPLPAGGDFHYGH